MKTEPFKLILLLFCYYFATGCTSSETSTIGTSATTNTETEQTTTSTTQRQATANSSITSETSTQDQVSVSNPIGSKTNIMALVQQNPDLSILLDLIRTADMVVVLESPVQHTLFAPANSTFSALPAGTLEALKRPESKMELTRLLQAHVVPGAITSASMADKMQMETAQGDKIQISKTGDALRVGGAVILTPDVQASNGVIHVVNKVLVPPQN